VIIKLWQSATRCQRTQLYDLYTHAHNSVSATPTELDILC